MRDEGPQSKSVELEGQRIEIAPWRDRMTDDFSFDAETFLALSVNDRVHLCKRLAERTQEMADAAEPKYRASYLEIARQWLDVAYDMLRADREKTAAGH
jgi:hypothetical protein